MNWPPYRWSEWRRSNARNVSFIKIFEWPIYINNGVNDPKAPFASVTESLENEIETRHRAKFIVGNSDFVLEKSHNIFRHIAWRSSNSTKEFFKEFFLVLQFKLKDLK